MSYRTSPFSPLALRVSSSDAPYGLQLEMAFKTFNGEVLPATCQQHLEVSSRITLRSREAARQAVSELRALADAVEAYIPNLKLEV